MISQVRCKLMSDITITYPKSDIRYANQKQEHFFIQLLFHDLYIDRDYRSRCNYNSILKWSSILVTKMMQTNVPHSANDNRP